MAPETPQIGVINEKLAEINALIAPYQLAYVSPVDDCVLLERNARYMPKEMMARLTANVKGDGFLSQLPFCVKEANGKFRVLSGNHRVIAARNATLHQILILYQDAQNLSTQKQTAIQLSHNSIAGKDDMQILQDLYASITDIAEKAYTGLDSIELFEMKAVEVPAISEADIELAEVNFLFSDMNKENVTNALDQLEKRGFDEKTDILILGKVDEFLEVMTRVKKRLNIKNRSVALLMMIETCKKWIANEDAKNSTCGTNGGTGG